MYFFNWNWCMITVVIFNYAMFVIFTEKEFLSVWNKKPSKDLPFKVTIKPLTHFWPISPFPGVFRGCKMEILVRHGLSNVLDGVVLCVQS